MSKPASYFSRLRRPRKVRTSKPKRAAIDRASAPSKQEPEIVVAKSHV